MVKPKTAREVHDNSGLIDIRIQQETSLLNQEDIIDSDDTQSLSELFPVVDLKFKQGSNSKTIRLNDYLPNSTQKDTLFKKAKFQMKNTARASKRISSRPKGSYRESTINSRAKSRSRSNSEVKRVLKTQKSRD